MKRLSWRVALGTLLLHHSRRPVGAARGRPDCREGTMPGAPQAHPAKEFLMSMHPSRSASYEGRAGATPFGEGADRSISPCTECYDDGTIGSSPHPRTGDDEVESNAAVVRPVPAGVKNTDFVLEGPGE
jgi:hypothetical protein